MSAAASSQDFASATLRAVLALDFRNWHFGNLGPCPSRARDARDNGHSRSAEVNGSARAWIRA
jgi:hypothetical protein